MLATFEQLKNMENNNKILQTRFELNAETIKGIKNVIKGHKNSAIPYLNYILMEMVNKNVVKVIYTDTDLCVEKMFFANVEHINRKSFLVPIELFKSIKNIKKTDTFIFEEDNKDILILTRNNLKHKISILDSENYPNFDFLEEDQFTMVETSNGYEYFHYKDLTVLNKASKSVANSESRPTLQEISIKNGYVISTDSHRLYRAKTIFNYENGFLINPVLVNKAMDIFDNNMFLKMSVNTFRIKIQDDYSTKVYFNHKDGNFPDTDRIMPNDFNYEVNIDNVTILHDFLKNMKKATINFTLDVSKSIINLEAELKSGIASISLPVRINKHSENEFKMSFDSSYLKDGIEQLDKESLIMKIVANDRPFVLNKQKCNKETVLLLPLRKNK